LDAPDEAAHFGSELLEFFLPGGSGEMRDRGQAELQASE
jgi:hypothetical protein